MMIKLTKTIYTVTGNGKEVGYKTKEKAIDSLRFITEFFNNEISFTIEERTKIEYEIEKGDKVHWIINNEIIYSRVDKVTKIIKDIYGDIRYKTREINGDKIGVAYEQDICLVTE